MFAVVPLVGLLAGGSWRASWQYTKTWLLCLAIVGAAGGVLTLGTEYWLTSDASGKLVAAVHGDNVIAKLLKINKGGAASADGDEITVEIVSSFLAVDN